MPLSQANLCASARAVAASLELTPDDRCLAVMPLFHIHGLVASVLAPVASGSTVVCTTGFDATRFHAWLEALRESDPELAFERAGLALVLIQATGQQVPEQYWQAVLQPPRRSPVMMPPPAFAPALDNAARGGRIGETVLLSILMLGQDGAFGADAALLRGVIAALRAVGLDKEGRALALEAALVNGL